MTTKLFRSRQLQLPFGTRLKFVRNALWVLLKCVLRVFWDPFEVHFGVRSLSIRSGFWCSLVGVASFR